MQSAIGVIFAFVLLVGVHAATPSTGHKDAATSTLNGRRQSPSVVPASGGLERAGQPPEKHESAATSTLNGRRQSPSVVPASGGFERAGQPPEKMAVPHGMKPLLRAIAAAPRVRARTKIAPLASVQERALRPVMHGHGEGAATRHARPVYRAGAASTILALAGRTSKVRVQIDLAAQMDIEEAAKMMGTARRTMETAVHAAASAAVGPPASAGGAAAESCGKLSAQPNAVPENYKDSMKTRYMKVEKKTVAVTFKPGDVIPFKCKKGYTVDGSKSGSRVFDVKCLPHGYYKPSKACIEISPCGALPSFNHSHPTGKKGGKSGEQLEYACDTGYSLDGKDPVPGNLNTLFSLECNKVSGTWGGFKGKCQPYAFVPATEIIKAYNSIFSVLFQLSCSCTLKNEFGKLKGPPAGLDKVCAVGLEGDCASLITKIKSDFESRMKERIEFDKEKSSQWLEANTGAPMGPNINGDAAGFCKALWGLLVLTPS